MTEDQIEKVAAAIEAVKVGSRFNDWTSDCVPGWPIEIFIYDAEADEQIIVERFPASAGEARMQKKVESRLRAIAAIKAMTPNDGDECFPI